MHEKISTSFEIYNGIRCSVILFYNSILIKYYFISLFTYFYFCYFILILLTLYLVVFSNLGMSCAARRKNVFWYVTFKIFTPLYKFVIAGAIYFDESFFSLVYIVCIWFREYLFNRHVQKAQNAASGQAKIFWVGSSMSFIFFSFGYPKVSRTWMQLGTRKFQEPGLTLPELAKLDPTPPYGKVG